MVDGYVIPYLKAGDLTEVYFKTGMIVKSSVLKLSKIKIWHDLHNEILYGIMLMVSSLEIIGRF